MERPFWLIKTLSKILKDAIKNKRGGFKNLYGWRKLYDDKQQKEFIYYPFVLRFRKK